MKLIDKLLDSCEEAVKAAKKPFIKKKIERVFESALDDVDEKRVNAELKIQDLRETLVKDPENAATTLNEIIEQRSVIRRSELTVEVIKQEKEEWFSEV